MTEAEFKRRTKEFALRAIRLVDALPKTRSADVIGRQLLRSATSVGANYRAACRAQSNRDMRARLADVEEEADESVFWMELLTEAGLVPANRLVDLMSEGDWIVAMTVASIKTLRAREPRRPRHPKS
jgi:four helix bundle protein